MQRLSKLSIMFGIIIGGIVALIAKDGATAILSGIFSAGLTTWICSLEWSRERVRELARTSSAKLGINLKETRRVAWVIITFLPKRIFKEIPELLKKDPYIRKVYAYTLTLLLLAVLSYVITNKAYSTLFVISEIHGMSTAMILHGLFVLALILAGVVVSLLVYIVVGMILFISLFSSNIVESLGAFRERAVPFVTDYLSSAEKDTRNTFVSTFFMLGIRTINVVNILLVFPTVFSLWCLSALASKRTGLKSLIAMSIAGLYLSFAYDFGGISASNPNFWLSFSIAAMVGAWLGNKIHDEVKIEQMELPEWDYFNILVKN